MSDIEKAQMLLRRAVLEKDFALRQLEICSRGRTLVRRLSYLLAADPEIRTEDAARVLGANYRTVKTYRCELKAGRMISE